MSKKYKLTGCARFLIFAVIFVPLVYFGVSYFRGEDPVALIKNELPENILPKKKTKPSTVSEEAIRKGKTDAQRERIIQLEERVDQLEKIIKAKDKQIKQLQRQQ